MHFRTQFIGIHILLSIMLSWESFAQNGSGNGNYFLTTSQVRPPKYLLTIAPFNEAAVPSFLNPFRSPLHPGVSAGVERFLGERKRHYWSWASNIAFYHHRLLENGLFVNTEIGLSYPLGAFYAQSFLGVGYLHTFVPAKVYNHTNGGYKEQNDIGKGHFMPSLSLRGGYKPWAQSGSALGLFLQYQIIVDTSFSSANGVPVLPHGLLCAGVSIPISLDQSSE